MTIAHTTTPNAASTRTKGKGRNGKAAKPANGQDAGTGPINGTTGTGCANGDTRQSTPERKAPVIYSEEIADIICQRLREGESLLSICSSDDLPSESAVRQWAADPAHPFAANYARAREVGYLKMADEVIALSDGLEAGDSRFEPGVVQRHRLMVDSRKWLLSKTLPKIYGDRIDARLSDADGKPLQVTAAIAIRALIEALPDLVNSKVLDALPQPVPVEPTLATLTDGERS